MRHPILEFIAVIINNYKYIYFFKKRDEYLQTFKNRSNSQRDSFIKKRRLTCKECKVISRDNSTMKYRLLVFDEHIKC